MIFWQYLLPKHFLSTLVHKITKIRTIWFKNLLIKSFVKKFGVNLSEAVHTKAEYFLHFNDFFTRNLQSEARKISANALVCPVDGTVSQLGNIHSGHIIIAKSQTYSLLQLLGDEKKADIFLNAHCMTVYLSPKDYHRIHMPCDGRLKSMIYIPGTLFSVNQTSVANIPALLARNERVICYFDTIFGEIAIVLVGAIFVGSMQTVWHQKITPPYGKSVKQWTYDKVNISLNKGEELGRFNMGSTILLLLPNQLKEQNKNFFNQVQVNDSVKMGQPLIPLNSIKL